MGFVDELEKARKGSSSVYGSVAPDNNNHFDDILSIRQRIGRDDMNAFKDKANFMSDLSQRANPMQRIFNPGNDGMNSQPPRNGLAGMNAPAVGNVANTVFREDPDRITPFQQAGLNIRREDNTIDRERISQQGRLGEEGLKIRQQQTDLNQQKSDQIKDQKSRELEAKIADSDARLKLAHDKLEQNANDARAHAEFNQAALAATNARHALTLAQRDKELEELKKYREEQIKAKNQPIETNTKSERDEEGNIRTTKTTKGPKKSDDRDPGGFRK